MRIRLTNVMIVVGAIAAALGAVRGASPLISTAALYGTYATLVVASTGAAIHKSRRGSWAGFAILGWAYFAPLFVFESSRLSKHIPTIHIINYCAYISLDKPLPPQGLQLAVDERRWPKITFADGRANTSNAALMASIDAYNERVDNAVSIGHCCVAIAVASLGSLLGRTFQAHSVMDDGCNRD